MELSNYKLSDDKLSYDNLPRQLVENRALKTNHSGGNCKFYD